MPKKLIQEGSFSSLNKACELSTKFKFGVSTNNNTQFNLNDF